MDQENPMRKVRIEKVVLSIGATGESLERGVKLLRLLTGKTPAKMMSRKRIPNFGVRPGLEVGTVVTIRKNMDETLKKMLAALNNTLKKRQIGENGFSFGIDEYIEIPGVEYQRDIDIIGLDVTVVFKRSGRRVSQKKAKKGKMSKKQRVSKQEIIKFMEENFGTKFT